MAVRTIRNGVWLPYVAPNPSPDLRLFCFPYAGAGASVYATWVHELPRSIQVCPVELPGRESRIHEARIRRIDAMVDAAIAGLTPYFDRPFAFFGHSMGALIAYAVAVAQARAGGPTPCHLFVSGRRAPHVLSDEPARDLSDQELCDRLRELGGIAPEVLDTPELMTLLLPILRDDFALCDSYAAAGTMLATPISVFGGLDDREVSRDDLDRWRERTSSRCTLRMLPGDHFFLRPERSSIQHAILDDLRARETS